MDHKEVEELLYQALETEIGGQNIYEKAIECAENDDLKKEWQKYLDETRNHEKVLRDTFQRIGLDAEKASPGRAVVRFKGNALVEAETKDHQNWEIIGEVAKALDGKKARALEDAYGQVEEQEDEHLYHTAGWSRELWMQSLGLPAVLPPPEEERDVHTAIGAARAKQDREKLL